LHGNFVSLPGEIVDPNIESPAGLCVELTTDRNKLQIQCPRLAIGVRPTEISAFVNYTRQPELEVTVETTHSKGGETEILKLPNPTNVLMQQPQAPANVTGQIYHYYEELRSQVMRSIKLSLFVKPKSFVIPLHKLD
jgi:hypothetical protein